MKFVTARVSNDDVRQGWLYTPFTLIGQSGRVYAVHEHYTRVTNPPEMSEEANATMEALDARNRV